MEGLTPTFDVGSGNGSGSALAAAGGAFVGSWFGNGNGWNGRNYDAGVAAENLIIDTINTNRVSNEVQGVGTAITALQNSTNQGFAGLNTANLQAISSLQNSTNQGFAGLNTAVVGMGKDNELATSQSTNAIVSAIKDCCCITQKEIIAQGNATRELQLGLYTKGVETALCDAKAKISTLESNAFTAANNGQQTQVILAHLSSLIGK